MADLNSLDFSAVTPAEFSGLIKSASKQELADLMSGPDRDRVLDEVFARMGSSFKSDVGGHLDAVIRWQLTSPAGAVATYELSIAKGKCESSKGRSDAEPTLTVSMDDTDFLKLVSGNANGPMLFMTRKLRADGDVGLAASLTRYFDIPRA
jgi:SCP-2 sterol transfer family